MPLDVAWVVSVSLTGIAVTVILLAVINTRLKHSSNWAKTNGIEN
jgi:mannose/fructose/N-acetylgalactosamine-specific phosphotransferase system component IIC